MKKKFHFSSEIHTVFSYEISSLSVHLSLRLRLVNGAGLDRIAIEGGRGPKERLGEEDEGEIVGENVGERAVKGRCIMSFVSLGWCS